MKVKFSLYPIRQRYVLWVGDDDGAEFQFKDISDFVGHLKLTKSDVDRLASINQGPLDAASLPLKSEGRGRFHTRRFQPQRYSTHSWLKYSPAMEGAFCLACVLLGGETVGTGGQVQLGVLLVLLELLVKKNDEPLQAKEIINNHNCHQYHLTAVTRC